MPDGMNGKELARRLLQENPRLKIIYASGYSADIAGKDLRLEEGVNFLTKPFEAHKLAQPSGIAWMACRLQPEPANISPCQPGWLAGNFRFLLTEARKQVRKDNKTNLATFPVLPQMRQPQAVGDSARRHHRQVDAGFPGPGPKNQKSASR